MTDADLDAVVAAERRIQRYPWTRGNFSDSLAAGHGAWVLREAGALSAYAITMVAVDETHLLNIGVLPEHQRAGRGSAMVERLCREARALGMRRMLLEVRVGNQAARAFYRHHGFAEIGLRRGYYPAPGGGEDASVMAREL